MSISEAPSTRSLIFAALFSIGWSLHMAEKWNHPLPVVICLVLAAAVVWLDRDFRIFFWYVLLSAIWVIYRLPDVANHSNLFLICCLVLLVSAARNRLAPNWVDGAIPALRVLLPVAYFWAGFHKLNSGFFEPRTSCSTHFSDRLGKWLHIDLPELSDQALVGVAVGVVALEIGLAFGLLWKRTRPWAILVALGFHGLLAFIRFFDFAAIAMSLLILFVPEDVLAGSRRLRLPALGDWWRGYWVGSIAVAVLSFLEYMLDLPIRGSMQVQGAIVVASMGLMVLALLVGWQIAGRWNDEWRLWRPRASTLGWALAASLFAMTPYFGLRSTGAFSMFSNLRTSDPYANHLLLGSSPLKFAGYVDDLVVLHWVAPADTRGTLMRGHSVPRVEIEKEIDRARLRGAVDVRVSLTYDGRQVGYVNLLEYDFGNEVSWLEKKLLDFRAIPTEGDRCTW